MAANETHFGPAASADYAPRLVSRFTINLPAWYRFLPPHSPQWALVLLGFIVLVAILMPPCLPEARGQEMFARNSVLLENGRLILTRDEAPASPFVVRVWWSGEPQRRTAAPSGPFSVFVEPDLSLRLVAEFDILDYDRAFFFVETDSQSPILTTDLGRTPGEFFEAAGARLEVTIEAGGQGEFFHGPLEFSLTGPNQLYGAAMPLSQAAYMQGNSATVSVLDLDDREVTGPQTVVLRLADAQVSDAAEYQKVIVIEDDDFFWSGSVDLGFQKIPLRIKWTKGEGGPRLTYISDGTGVIPAGSYSESRGAPLTDLETPLEIPGAISGDGPGGLDADLLLSFSEIQSTATTISGDAALTLAYIDLSAGGATVPYLESTSSGTFFLRREPQPVRDREPPLER